MPSTRPCAAFEPISPDFNVSGLVESTPNFEWVVRIDCDMIDHQGIEQFEKLVLIHVILGGKPLVVEGYDRLLDRWTFAVQWLRDNTGTKVENPSDLTKKVSVPMTFAHYLNHMALLTNQWTKNNYKDPQRQRIYLKDIDCPQLWHDKLQTVLPPFLYYLNSTTGDIDGFGATDEPDPSGTGYRRGKGIAKAGDLMSCLPKEVRAENMMCYIGHEGTYTPAHREMCASLGQNIMVEASTGLVEDGKPTKPGSSLWFMTENKEREVVAEYWLSRLGHDIEVENHFAQINAWKNAPFKTYVVEQKPGDLILIPPLATHQVWNRGTRTMKVAWNRTTVETLEMALNEALPKARMVCRDEQYKNKAIVYFALQQYSRLLKLAEKHKSSRDGKVKTRSDIKVRQLEKDFRRLHGLFTQTLVAESFLPTKQEKCELVPYEGFITCSYCRGNIFNRFLTCSNCIIHTGAEEDTYDVCMECYAMGRSCACVSKLKWVEQFPWLDLIQKHEAWRHQILGFEGEITEKSPMYLKVELQRLGRKHTLAQVCQLELQRRPWRDIKKPAPQPEAVDRYEEVEVDENGNNKKKKKVRRSEKFVRDHGRCHIDKHWEPKWKQAECVGCGKFYCYGVLFRAFDMLPQNILADPDWTCPSCQGVCGCRTCRTNPDYKPYTPSGTRLGHNTKSVADARSVESLVDFSFSNIGWIQKAGDDDGDYTKRLKRRRMEADFALAQDTQLAEDYAEENFVQVEDGIIPIDPALATVGGAPRTPGSGDDEDIFVENPEGRQESAFAVAPMEPQHVIPHGGVLRDQEHAYKVTDAITYDYPDLNVVLAPAPLPDEETSIGNITAEADEDHIEMVSRKRKRKLDQSEKAFVYNRSLNPPKNKTASKKQHKSLIVKLPINKTKLAEINKMAIIAQRALNGVEPAPAVIGSDLQALNTSYSGAEGQPAPKKARTDQVIVDHDTEYAPSRRRDRRRAGPSGESATRQDDITRRQTRMQAVTYEEPSDEEEFNEVVQRPASEDLPSKLATMEHAIDVEDIDDVMSASGQDGPIQQDDTNTTKLDVAQDDLESSPEPAVRLSSGLRLEPQSALDMVRATDSSSTSVSKEITSLPPSRQWTANTPRPSTNTISAKALAKAAANRRAKMAAFEDSFSDDLIDDWSDQEVGQSPDGDREEQSDRPSSGNGVHSDASSVPLALNSPKSSSTKVTQPTTTTTRLATVEKVAASNSAKSAAVKANLKSTRALTEADWSDSDSDSSGVPYTGAASRKDQTKTKTAAAPAAYLSSGWATVNGAPNLNGMRRLQMGAAGKPVGSGVKRGRGRPTLHR